MKNEFLKNPPKKYRPSPFWSWNEKLDTAETANQVRQMDEVGIGGAFMHARGGLQTEYLSDEWFDNIRAALDEGKNRDMCIWGYDENGWPSGFGSGTVNGLGEKYQEKYLRCKITDAPETDKYTVANVPYNGKNAHLYYEINSFYVDTLDGEVIDEFLRSTHIKYKEALGDKFTYMKGFFTDEPQVSRNGVPWSLIIEREYKAAYGKDLKDGVLGLIYDVDGCYEVRYNFWKLVGRLYAQNYMKKIGDWCRNNGSALTGHLVLEEGYYNQIMANGACMPLYEYFDIPGMDNLGRRYAWTQTEMQLSSAANQLGKKQILSETFACCGWNVSFEDLRRIYEHQMVHGINYLCQHLEGYSLRGIRKRDYPASLFKQQPWWKHYRVFNDMVSRIGMLVAEGSVDYNILVLHTIASGWMHIHPGNAGKVEGPRIKMIDVMSLLEAEQLQYHLGDEGMMQKHGSVSDGKITIGSQNYGVVIVPPASCIDRNTYNMLCDFKNQGGLLIFCEQVPEYIDGIKSDEVSNLADGCPVCELNDVTKMIPDTFRKIRVDYEDKNPAEAVKVLVRRFDDEQMTMYYLDNHYENKHEATVTVKGGSAEMFDPIDGVRKPVVFTKDGENLKIYCTLYENGSVILFVYDDARAISGTSAKELTSVSDKCLGEWTISSKDDNAITLDYCDLYFDGKKVASNLPIGDVQEKACAIGKKVKTKVVFNFTVKKKAFTKCELVVETPEIFDIEVNGKIIDKTVLGFCHDVAFKRIDIAPAVQEGYNEISLTCDFVQSPGTYENTEKSKIFESEKNKLTYDMEIEAIYLSGDFGVYTDDAFIPLENRAMSTNGRFYLDAARDTVTVGSIAPQGYPFFAGSMTFKKSITLTADEAKNAKFTIDKLCSNVTTVKVNGKDAGNILWRPYELDISPFAKEGENIIEVTVCGNLRNLLGPFHLTSGECFAVGPNKFLHESPIWCNGTNREWADSYCFVEFGLFF